MSTQNSINNIERIINYCINGNFDIWQRGTSFTNPANGAYTADRIAPWINVDGGTPPTIVHSRQTLTPGELDKSFYFYRINANGAGSGYGNSSYYTLYLQQIENGTRLLCGLNKKITISFYARSSVNGRVIVLEPIQNYGGGGIVSSEELLTPLRIILTTSWTKYTHTFTTNTLVGKTFGDNYDDRLKFWIWLQGGSTYNSRITSPIPWASGNIDIAQIQINAGDTALDYIAPTFEDELRKCMRYYEKSCNSDVYPQNSYSSYNVTGCYGIAAASTAIIPLTSCFKVEKRITPAIVISGGEGATAGINYVRDNTAGGAKYMGSAPSVNWTTKTNLCYYIGQGGTGANALTPGHYYSFYWTADAEF